MSWKRTMTRRLALALTVLLGSISNGHADDSEQLAARQWLDAHLTRCEWTAPKPAPIPVLPKPVEPGLDVYANNDPVIGIWAQTRAPEDPGAKHLQRVEWIFNDAYLGRYHVYEGTEITISTDFQWEARGTVYTIHYPGLKKVEDVVRAHENTRAQTMAFIAKMRSLLEGHLSFLGSVETEVRSENGVRDRGVEVQEGVGS